jgi:hemolysin D
MTPIARHPLAELLARYGAVLKAAWQQRHELAGPRRLADEQAFLPAALSLQETPMHPAPRRAALAICALFVIALLWAVLGRIDIVAVAQGRIVVSQRSKLIQPLETSVVTAIHVKDGDRVVPGQLLIELDGTAPQADHNRVQQERAAAVGEVRRMQALLQALAGGPPPQWPSTGTPAPGAAPGAARVPALAAAPADASLRPDGDAAWQATQRALLQTEWADITAQLARLQAELQFREAEGATAAQAVRKLQTTLPLARQREEDIQRLSEQGFVTGHAGQDRTRERIELEQDLATAQARQAETRAALAQARQAETAYRAETRRSLQDRLTQASLKASQLGEEAAKTTQRTQLTRLTAPVAGTVQQLAVHTAGGVVTPAQVLLVLVPEHAEVTADVVLENKDVGFVRGGQAAEIKLETFPFTRYGTVPARVTAITADAVLDDKRGAIFPATLRLEQAGLDVDGRRIRLAPGMNVTAEIKTGRRRVIDYLLSPVQQAVSESLKER